MAGNDDDPLRIGGVARPAGTGATTPAEATAGAVAAAEAGTGVAPADRVQSEAVNPTASVAEALATGAIDGDAALRALVEQATAAVLGPAADPAQVAAVRAEVQALLADDPTLASLLRA